MAVDIGALASELTTDPLARGYAGMSDQAAADDLNLKIYAAPVTATQVRDYIMLLAVTLA
jgi:hypothetical protein